MTLQPLLNAPIAVQVHAIAALFALLVGPFALWRKRRDVLHKGLGYTWVATMTTTAVSSFLISSAFSPIGIGPIHLLSIFSLWGLIAAMRAIYARDVWAHSRIMKAIYVRGLVLAGSFTLLPGRMMQEILIPEVSIIGYGIVALVLIWAFAPFFSRMARSGLEV